MLNSRILLALIIAVAVRTPVFADWPQFRGSVGKANASPTEHPISWGETENVAWSVSLPGTGWSSPVVVGDRVFVTMAGSASGNKPVGMTEGVRNMQSMGLGGKKPTEEFRFSVACLNLADGKILWEKSLAEKIPPYPVHPSNSFATESPVTDGKNLFVYFGAIGLVASLDLEGNVRWQKEVGAFKTGNDFGSGSSLTMHETTVFLQYDNEEKSFVIALNESDGNELWKRDRPYTTSWSTPLVWENKQGVELVVCGQGNVTSYDLKSGEDIWTLKGISSSFSASPVADSQRVYFGNSGPFSSGPLVAMESGYRGVSQLKAEKETPGVAWSKLRAGPGMSSPALADDFLYISGSGGIMHCYKASTGERLYRERLPQAATIASSLWTSQGYLFALDEDGKCFVLKVGEKFELFGTNSLPDTFWSTPAISGGSLLLRGIDKLYCIRQK